MAPSLSTIGAAVDLVERCQVQGIVSLDDVASAADGGMILRRHQDDESEEFHFSEDGQRIDIPETYHRQTWVLIRKLVTDISNAAIAKVP